MANDIVPRKRKEDEDYAEVDWDAENVYNPKESNLSKERVPEYNIVSIESSNKPYYNKREDVLEYAESEDKDEDLYELDLDWSNNRNLSNKALLNDAIKTSQKYKLYVAKFIPNGPGAGWPIVTFRGKKQDQFKPFLKQYSGGNKQDQKFYYNQIRRSNVRYVYNSQNLERRDMNEKVLKYTPVNRFLGNTQRLGLRSFTYEVEFKDKDTYKYWLPKYHLDFYSFLHNEAIKQKKPGYILAPLRGHSSGSRRQYGFDIGPLQTTKIQGNVFPKRVQFHVPIIKEKTIMKRELSGRMLGMQQKFFSTKKKNLLRLI